MAVSLFDGGASVLMVAGLKQSSKGQNEERENGDRERERSMEI